MHVRVQLDRHHEPHLRCVAAGTILTASKHESACIASLAVTPDTRARHKASSEKPTAPSADIALSELDRKGTDITVRGTEG